MINTLALTLLFILPLLVFPFGISYFETPKVILAQVLIDLLAVVWFLKTARINFKSFSKTQLVLSLALLALTILQLIVFNPGQLLFGNVFRLQGIFLLWHLLIFSLISSTLKLPGKTSTLALFSLTALVVLALIFGQNLTGRAIGTLGEPNALAATAVFFFPFAFLKQKLPVKILSFISAMLIIILSGSRSGLVAFILESIFLLLSIKFTIKPALVFILILLFLSLTLPFLEARQRPNLPEFRFENRAEVWQTAYQAGLKSPIFGHGFGNITKPLNTSSILLSSNIQYQFVDSSHNIFLDFWVQGGILGLGILVSLIVFSIKGLVKNSKILELAASVGVLTALSFNPAGITTLLAFWYLLGQGFTKPHSLW